MSATILWEENIMTTKDLLNDLAKGLIPRQSKHYRGSVYSPRKQGIAKIAETIAYKKVEEHHKKAPHLSEKEIRESPVNKIGTVENESTENKKRTPKKTSSQKVRFITIAGERYRFDYEWGALDEFIAKQAYLDKEKNTIMVILNTRYHILKTIPKPDFFYHVIFLAEGIVEVFLKENKFSLEKVISLRDKLTQKLADIITEDIMDEDIKKDSQIIGAQTYLLKPQQEEIFLNENERFVLGQKIENSLTYQEIANELKVSRQRVERIFRTALNKINNIQVKKVKNVKPKIKMGMKTSEIIKDNIDSIIKSTAKIYNISVNDLLGGSRQAELVLPRHTAMYVLRKELNLSFSKIAEIMGKKDHTTVIYAYRKMKELIKKSE